ncbi:MAG: 1-aminocyclopropane-1-carboxylate deaminase/D-cysteine desulfhydrase [bacterium]
MNLDRLPRVSLARFPTPLDDAPRLAAALGVSRLLVKRDDLTDLSLGGNKVRKLEYLLGEALAQGADTVITTAGAQSNFLRITAAAARRLGMQPVFVVRGRPDALPEGNLLLMRVFGVDLRFVPTQDPYDASTVGVMREIEEQVRRRGGRPYLMHLATFSGGLATVGYVSAALELVQQLRARDLRCDYLALAVGSGTTYAGLLLGLRHAGMRCRILGASVNTAAATLRTHVERHMRAAAEILGLPSPDYGTEIDITDAHVGPGYGIPTDDSVEAIRLAAQTEGLVFDPIYTGKAWAALRHAVQSGAITRDATVIFLHSGGAPLIFQHAASVTGGAHVPIRHPD